MEYKKVIVFDLDDTLYKEINYVYSAFRAIALFLNLDLIDEMKEVFLKGENVFQYLILKYDLNYSIDDLLVMYRNHYPEIILQDEALNLLKKLKESNYYLGIITDGRSITQRNKLKALGIINFFDLIIISEEIGTEKPNINNYLPFMDAKAEEYYYIGDNDYKDFNSPNFLKWITIKIAADENNIKRQNKNKKKYIAKHVVSDFTQLSKLIC